MNANRDLDRLERELDRLEKRYKLHLKTLLWSTGQDLGRMLQQGVRLQLPEKYASFDGHWYDVGWSSVLFFRKSFLWGHLTASASTRPKGVGVLFKLEGLSKSLRPVTLSGNEFDKVSMCKTVFDRSQDLEEFLEPAARKDFLETFKTNLLNSLGPKEWTPKSLEPRRGRWAAKI